MLVLECQRKKCTAGTILGNGFINETTVLREQCFHLRLLEQYLGVSYID